MTRVMLRPRIFPESEQLGLSRGSPVGVPAEHEVFSERTRIEASAGLGPQVEVLRLTLCRSFADAVLPPANLSKRLARTTRNHAAFSHV
jgi:hypothetical protein